MNLVLIWNQRYQYHGTDVRGIRNSRYVCMCVCTDRYRSTGMCMLVYIHKFPNSPCWEDLGAIMPQCNKPTSTQILVSECHSPIGGSRDSEKWLISGLGQKIHKMSWTILWYIPGIKGGDQKLDWGLSKGHRNLNEEALKSKTGLIWGIKYLLVVDYSS